MNLIARRDPYNDVMFVSMDAVVKALSTPQVTVECFFLSTVSDPIKLCSVPGVTAIRLLSKRTSFVL